jgi:hypothetical protein
MSFQGNLDESFEFICKDPRQVRKMSDDDFIRD